MPKQCEIVRLLCNLLKFRCVLFFFTLTMKDLASPPGYLLLKISEQFYPEQTYYGFFIVFLVCFWWQKYKRYLFRITVVGYILSF